MKSTRRGSDSPVHRPEKPPGSKYSSTSGLSPRGHLERVVFRTTWCVRVNCTPSPDCRGGEPTPKCLTRPQEPCFCFPSPLVTSGRGMVVTPPLIPKPTVPFRDAWSPHLLRSAEVDALVCSTADHADLPIAGCRGRGLSCSHCSHHSGSSLPSASLNTFPR